MKVAIDTATLTGGHSVRGIGIYTKKLITELKKLESSDFQMVDDGFDLLHVPYFDLFKNTLPKSLNAKLVVTIHDVIPLLYPKAYPPGIKGKINFLKQKWNLKKADLIITDSETSKKDIIRYLGVPAQKIKVIYLGPTISKSSVKSISDTQYKYDLPENFVLYVGDVNYNKNIVNLAESCQRAKTPLVIIGKQAASSNFNESHLENKPLVTLLEKFGDDKDVKRLGFVEEEDLVNIYKSAAVYVQPSLYEGFGLPVLDAFNLSCPVICSKTQCLEEIAQDAAYFVDPYDVESIASAIVNVLHDKKLRNELIKKGKQRVEYFSWKKTAQETLNAYRNIDAV